MQTIHCGRLERTPIGPVDVALGADGLIAIVLGREPAALETEVRRLLPSAEVRCVADGSAVEPVLAALDAYFADGAFVFQLPIDWSVMTAFQRRVLPLVAAIPAGETATYGSLAVALGNPQLARAVGRANATNPLPIVIPCHRVVGHDGSLVGYGGGVARKQWLLAHEGVALAAQMSLF